MMPLLYLTMVIFAILWDNCFYLKLNVTGAYAMRRKSYMSGRYSILILCPEELINSKIFSLSVKQNAIAWQISFFSSKFYSLLNTSVAGLYFHQGLRDWSSVEREFYRIQ